MKDAAQQINVQAKPSGTGCAECLSADGWWLHLRRCAECGHVGCCDSSPNQHASKHFHATRHRTIKSFEPGESWFYDYETKEYFDGPELAQPNSHPEDQPAPGPKHRVPKNWQTLLH